MASLSMSGPGSADQVADLLLEQIQDSALSCQLVDSIVRRTGGSVVRVMVFDKYYMRAGNRASLTVVVTEENGTVCVDAIGSGGGQGAIFNFSWGAEENFVTTVEDILREQGFR